MSDDCPKCDTEMLPADDFSCEKVDWVCPECARDFVVEGATTTETREGYNKA